jgi:hypothetical protein
MMYKKVVQALKAAGSKASPLDYLAFFCLGARETKKGSEGATSSKYISEEIKAQDFVGNQTRLADV